MPRERKRRWVNRIVWRVHTLFQPASGPLGEHFRLEGAAIRSLTEIGEVTARIFGFNDSARLQEREEASSQ